MNYITHRLARLGGLRVPAALLAGLLQRSPALRMVAAAADALTASRAADVIKAAAASVAALGAVDAVAGATTYTLSTGSPGHPSPYTVAAGSQIAGVAFDLVSNPQTAAPPESWTVSGQIPPGLEFGANGTFITSPGFVDTANPTLIGTPTTPGTYTLVLQAWENSEGTGLSSTTFNYQVVVQGTVPPPAPGTAPVFTTQPLSVTVTGGTVALDAAASGADSYQWMLNGTPVAGAANPTLLISDATTAAGSYTCVATNATGATTSAAAVVTLTATNDVGRMVNISARAQVGVGSDIIFGGFAVTGTRGSLPVLIRGSGPALAVAPFNVPGTLADPQLQLFDNAGNVLQTNNGWAGDAQVSADASAVGAFGWADPTSHDAALDLPLAIGTYTAQVSGQAGDTGDSLMEVYDASPAGSFAPGMPHLKNLSARVFVGTGSNALFAGFVIKGSTALTVLIRASGPALATFGIGGTLADPQLTLEYQATGGAIASNTGWGGNTEISDAAANVGGFPWGPIPTKDSALLITLPPGNYTAFVAGASGDTGDAIVEVYEVP